MVSLAPASSRAWRRPSIDVASWIISSAVDILESRVGEHLVDQPGGRGQRDGVGGEAGIGGVAEEAGDGDVGQADRAEQ